MLEKINNKKFIIKIFLIFLFLIIYMLFTNSKVKAMTFTYNDNEYNLPDLPEVSENFDGVHYSIFTYRGGYTLLTYVNYTNNSSYVYTSNHGSFGLANDGNSNGRVKIWYINSNGDGWYMNSWQADNYYFGYSSTEFNSTNFIYSTVNIYGALSANTPDTETVLFPQVAPTEEIIILTTTLEELPRAIIKMMTILIPVGLMIFGILLLIYLIRLLKF